MTAGPADAVFLLQETEPKRLIGSVSSTVRESGPGWVCISFLPVANVISLRRQDGQVSLVLTWSLALLLIAYVQIAAARTVVLRAGNPGQHSPAPFCADVISVSIERVRTDRRRYRKLLVCSWAADRLGVQYEPTGDETKILFREDLASTLALELIDFLARMETEQ